MKAKLERDDATRTIAWMGAKFGVTHRALRFYESKGMLAPRKDGRRRYYTADDVRWMRQILELKQLGFTILEISGMLKTAPLDEAKRYPLSWSQCSSQIAVLEQRLAEIERQLECVKQYQERLEEGPTLRPTMPNLGYAPASS
jgi:DNA-binding transcriptional MerR regulator